MCVGSFVILPDSNKLGWIIPHLVIDIQGLGRRLLCDRYKACLRLVVSVDFSPFPGVLGSWCWNSFVTLFNYDFVFDDCAGLIDPSVRLPSTP